MLAKKIAIGADHAGYQLKEYLKEYIHDIFTQQDLADANVLLRVDISIWVTKVCNERHSCLSSNGEIVKVHVAGSYRKVELPHQVKLPSLRRRKG